MKAFLVMLTEWYFENQKDIYSFKGLLILCLKVLIFLIILTINSMVFFKKVTLNLL